MTPTDPQLAPVELTPIDLGNGKEYFLKYTIGSCQRLKKKFGKSLLSGDGIRTLDEDTLPELIAEGLRDKQGRPVDLTAEQLSELIDTRQALYIVTQFFKAFSAAQPSEKNGSPAAAAPATAA